MGAATAQTDETPQWVPWVVDTVPRLIIGESGGQDYDLARVWSAARFSGGYVVSTGLPVGIRTYDHTGQFLRWIAREGYGPGELRSISGTWVTEGDTIVVADSWQSRVSYFRSDGTLIRTLRHESGGSANVDDARPRVLRGRFSDGSFLSIQSTTLPPGGKDGDEVTTGTDRYFREDLGKGSVALIVEAAGFEQSWEQPPGDPYGFWQSVPFSPTTANAVVDSILALADSRRFEVALWSTDGRIVGRFARDVEERPLTDEIWEGELDRRLRAFTQRVESSGNRYGLNVSSELALIRQRFRESVRVPTLPAHGGRMLAGPRGDLWIQAWSDEVGESSSVWHIFLTRSARFVGTVELPAHFRPTAIYDDAVLGIHRDELDVESIREYAIQRNGSPHSR